MAKSLKNDHFEETFEEQLDAAIISELEKSENLRKGIVGLKNNKLFCYMNATFQCLLPIQNYKNYYLERKNFNPERIDSNSYSIKMHEFFSSVFSHSRDADKPLQVDQSLIKLIQNKFDPDNQQDCHEFLIHLLNNLQSEENKDDNNKPIKNSFNFQQSQKRDCNEVFDEYLQSNPSFIDQQFTGFTATIIQCGNPACRHQLYNYNPFVVLSLECSESIH